MVLSSKTRLGMIFGANVLGLMVILLGQLNGSGLIPMLAILAACCYFIVFRSPDDEPVSVHLVTLAFMDLCAYVALNYQALSEAFVGENLSYAMNNLGEFYGLMLAGLLLLTIGILRIPWLLGVGGGFVGLALILGQFGGGSLDYVEFTGNGQVVVVVYILCAVFWTVCLFMASSAKTKTGMNTDPQFTVLSLLALAVSVYVAVGCASYADDLAAEYTQKIVALPTEAFAWWRVLACCVVLLGLAYAYASTYAYDKQLSWDVDSVIMLAWVVLVLGIRVLMDNYFVFSSALYLGLVIAVCWCVRNAAQGNQTLEQEPQHFMVIAFVFFTVLAHMLGQGLILSAVVTCVLTLVAYVQFVKIWPEASKIEFFVVLALTSEAAAWMFKRYYSVESFLMLGMVLVFSVVALFILNREHVGMSRSQHPFAIGVCVCVALLCWLSLRTSVEVKVETVDNNVTLTLQAKNADNPAKAVLCEWKNAFGQSVDKDSVKVKDKTVLPVQSDHLVVQVTDSLGVTETYDYYFAPWMHDFSHSKK